MEPREVLSEPAAVLALAEQVSPWLNGTASFALAGALEAIDAGHDLRELPEFTPVVIAIHDLPRARIDHWSSQLAQLDAGLVTVLDDTYPTNLRMIPDHPPFLFVRGALKAADERAIAVVGSRRPSRAGRQAAEELAASLAESGVTVVSGLALGIDTAAHAAALDVGGRTLAVLGTGIARVYPPENRLLAERICSAGATLSQFWPQMRAERWSFPARNIVTSGLSVGTLVIEADASSGAHQQVQHALRHGKRVFLHRQLVEQQDWAREMCDLPGVIAIDEVAEMQAILDLELTLEVDLST